MVAEAPDTANYEEEKMKTKTSHHPCLHHRCWSNSAPYLSY